ncbi:BlaI/MecI/CopY family transcriptional regulator [Labilibaculum sp. DW002]|uniref:BlaI/MecI/CopY family transcriptional regulator n=1 Tax=Paralabilibaculum antarcticum TaxID=2912572 RepID=A0ABT5VVP3_9BACT|nr:MULTISPECIES: BlaI/MecI/CopY family transcriptional regulator [unclassified Labilibaculum]MBI9059244.1 BlaI/MecI/CopY family transcriptional regulator [Labilibaculum sp.]MDE5419479.1 BlaI/MecI/CopY family transcriptional regulator [Labilibaculum sp. DW002]
MKELTKAEEQVMQIVWELEKTNVRDAIACFPDPKPAYTTVATVMNALDKKGFVNKIAQGKSHVFSVKIPKEDYSGFKAGALVTNYFNGSFSRMASFFAKDNKLSIQELEEMIEIAKKQIEKEK